MATKFGSEISGDLAIADQREWLVTNGLGSYASGTVGGTLTRSYHGLLIAALNPPINRTLLVTKLDETVQYGDRTFPIFSNRWSDGSISPGGNQYIQSFFLNETVPTWQFALGDALLEKRIWMQPGAHTTYVSYQLKRGTQPLKLSLTTLVNYRSHHGGTTRRSMALESVDHGVKVTAYDGATPFYLLSDRGSSQIAQPNDWYSGFKLDVEAYRGLNPFDDNLHASTLEVTLDQQTDSFTFVASTESNPTLDGATALRDRQTYEQGLLNNWQSAQPDAAKIAPDWIKQLVLAADQFIVDRTVDNQPGKSVIAGYHWFNDWGRDTMISLPGLTLITGRTDIAEQILRTFAKYISQGMLPNRFPDGSEQLGDGDYNTVDATLWYFEALRHHYMMTQNDTLIRDLFPKLQEIITYHRQGTRYNIKLDPNDGLISAGADGVQLTWMDAKVNGIVITPRRGKPVEVNALWYNALETMSKFAMQLGQDPSEYNTLAASTQKGFQRFWNNQTGYCFDVLDGPDGNADPTLRPNQLLALSLPGSLLTSDQAKKVLDACGRMLFTPHGVRSLTPDDSQYKGHYGGDQFKRDSAYHQGTVWGWLIGPFALAYSRTYNDPDKALQFLEPMAYHLHMSGMGSISEIFDGAAPNHPRGCIAQAWSVAEVLRTWVEITLSKRT